MVGIPKALLFYNYKYLWDKFFSELNIPVIYSQSTTKKTIKDGIKYSIDEACLSSKIFMGHVYSLLDRCDYILVPRICSFGKKEDVCVKFNALYDDVRSVFKNVNFITYDVDVINRKKEKNGFIEMGMDLGKTYTECKNAYDVALRYSNYMINKDIANQINDMINSTNKKILLISHSYNAFDPMVGLTIKKILNDLNIDVYDASIVDYNKAIKLSKKLSRDLYWTYSKILIGSILYYKDKIDGIVFLSSFPCGIDSLTNELVSRKLPDIPKINLIVDEQSGFAGIETRLESFADLLNGDKYG